MCKEVDGLALGDETTKIFLNTKGTADDVDSDMLEFLSYISDSTDATAKQSSSTLVKEIHKKVRQVKENKEMEVEYMTLSQRDFENRILGHEEGHAEGLSEGISIGRAEGLSIGLTRGIIGTYMEFNLPDEEILKRLQEKLNISKEEAKAYLDQYKENM